MGVAAASTPPASWFTCPDIFQLERRAVFGSSWVAVGRADQATLLIENASTRYLFAMLCLLNHGMNDTELKDPLQVSEPGCYFSGVLAGEA